MIIRVTVNTNRSHMLLNEYQQQRVIAPVNQRSQHKITMIQYSNILKYIHSLQVNTCKINDITVSLTNTVYC